MKCQSVGPGQGGFSIGKAVSHHLIPWGGSPRQSPSQLPFTAQVQRGEGAHVADVERPPPVLLQEVADLLLHPRARAGAPRARASPRASRPTAFIVVSSVNAAGPEAPRLTTRRAPGLRSEREGGDYFFAGPATLKYLSRQVSSHHAVSGPPTSSVRGQRQARLGERSQVGVGEGDRRHLQDVVLRALVVEHPQRDVEVRVGALEAVEAAAHGLVGRHLWPATRTGRRRRTAVGDHGGTFAPVASNAWMTPAIMPPS